MAEKILVARLTHEGKTYVGKRKAKMYDGSDEKTSDANVGLTLRIQREIRDALKVKHGLKTLSTGGVKVDLSAVESV